MQNDEITINKDFLKSIHKLISDAYGMIRDDSGKDELIANLKH